MLRQKYFLLVFFTKLNEAERELATDPAPLGIMVTMAPPPLLSKIMPKHDEDGGDIDKKILADSWG